MKCRVLLEHCCSFHIQHVKRHAGETARDEPITSQGKKFDVEFLKLSFGHTDKFTQ